MDDENARIAAGRAALLKRARALAGLTVASLPLRTLEHKGSVGQQIEVALGLVVHSRPVPDAEEIGVEVKTLPVAQGRVRESTWVTSAPPESLATETWLTSRVRHKLAHVLFVPVETAPVPSSARRIGTAFLWEPSDAHERLLQADWEDLADLVCQGVGFAVSARRGRVLQLRPKARNARVRRETVALDGESISIAPQGFYLRPSFTQGLLDAVFGDQRTTAPAHPTKARR